MGKTKSKQSVDSSVSPRSNSSARAEDVLAKAPAAEVTSSNDWLDVARQLEGREFANLEEALECVINEVVERVGRKDRPAAELKSFLQTLLATDPQLQEELQKILKC